MDKDSFRYYTNVVPAGTIHPTAAGQWGETVTWVEPDEYRAYIAERNAIIDREPYQIAAQPSAAQAVWETALFLMERMSIEHPAHFRLHREGEEFVWENDLLDVRQRFTYGDDSTLPGGPLEYIGRQTTDDLMLLHEQEGKLWMDAGVLLIWSLPFTLGMSFDHLHTRTAVAVPPPVIERAHRYLLRLEPGEMSRRTSWVFQRGDTVMSFLNPADNVKPAAAFFVGTGDAGEPVDDGKNIHMRIEIQHLIRLPRTGHVLFTITTRLLSLEDIASIPAWATQLLSIFENQDPETYQYKGLASFDGAIENYLRKSLAIEVDA
jgi:hypothetical protein